MAKTKRVISITFLCIEMVLGHGPCRGDVEKCTEVEDASDNVDFMQSKVKMTKQMWNSTEQEWKDDVKEEAKAENKSVVPQSASRSFPAAIVSLNHTQTEWRKRMWISMFSQPTTTGASNGTAGLLRDSRQQVQDFTFAASVTCGSLILLVWGMSNGVQNCPSSLLAILSCTAFGLDNFLMDYAACYLQVPSAHAALTFLVGGMAALTIHLLWLWFRTSYHAEWSVIASSSWSVIFLILLTGLLIASGQLCGNIGFNISQEDSGPHQALVCVSVMIVAPFFYFYSGETLTRLEIMGCALICGGVIVMSDVSHWGENSASMYSYLWLILSMIFYAFGSITWRLSSLFEDEFVLPWIPQLLLIYGCMGLVGFSLSPNFLFAGGFNEYIQHPVLLLWPALNAVDSFLGMLCMNLVFQKKDVSTGAVVAVVDSNSLVLLSMNKLALGLEPSGIKVAGMAIILVGCVTTCSADIFFPAPPQEFVRQTSGKFVRLGSRALSAPGLLCK